MVPGHHVAAWRHPDDGAEKVLQLDFYKELAQNGLHDVMIPGFKKGYFVTNGREEICINLLNYLFNPINKIRKLITLLVTD